MSVENVYRDLWIETTSNPLRRDALANLTEAEIDVLLSHEGYVGHDGRLHLVPTLRQP